MDSTPVKKKIFFESTAITANHISGIGHVLLDTLNALDKNPTKNYDFYVFAPFGEAKKLKKYNFKHIKVRALPVPHKVFTLFSRLRLSPPIDIFLGKGVYVFPNYRNLNLLFSKSITYIHDVCFKIYPQYIQPRNLDYLNKHINIWLKRTDIVATVSDSSKNEIIKYLNVPEQKIVVAKNAINKDVFYPRHKNEVEKVKRKHGLKNYFIFIGNIEPRKNIQNLIAAFEEFSKEHKGMTLFIVGGDGWLNEKIIKDVKDAKKNDIDVRMSDGYISPDEDLPALITGAKALIQPSWHEGFGMPVTQALACKTPVICSNIAVFREITAGWGGWVYFFNPKDIHNLAKILSKIDKPTQKNKAKIQGWDVTALKLLNVCYNMTNERKK